MDLAIVEQQDDAPGGYLADWARERGHRVELLRAQELGTAWPDPGRYGAIAALGAEHSVHASPDPWIGAEVAFLRAAHEAGVPLLGLCFGGQALAAALGAEVRLAPRAEIGWYELESVDGGEIPPGPWFQWHFDTFAVPPGARELARTPHCPQAFRLGSSIGLQFHPEATPEIIADWIRTGRDSLVRNGLDADALRAQTRAAGPGARARAYTLFDAIARAWTDGPRTSVHA
ncbi:MAG TPA: type 1 glutamine amidotransferase [Solirubrobacteraceae bacterium]|nr:type 1 glutamine amidotransferase [Solirubrobacteraceae bacterium]